VISLWARAVAQVPNTRTTAKPVNSKYLTCLTDCSSRTWIFDGRFWFRLIHQSHNCYQIFQFDGGRIHGDSLHLVRKKFSSARLGSSVYCARLSGILPPDTRVLEMLCSPIDQEKYNREIGNTVNGTNDKGKTEP